MLEVIISGSLSYQVGFNCEFVFDKERKMFILVMCVCLLAKGPVFCSGHDLKELTSSQGRDHHTQVFRTCAEVGCYQTVKYDKLPLKWPISWENWWARPSHTDCSLVFLWFQVMMLIQDIPVPVIAMVNGIATAAGCQLVASCDVAVVTEKSTFATPGVNVGLFCSTPAVAIGRAVPRKVRVGYWTPCDLILTSLPFIIIFLIIEILILATALNSYRMKP